MTNYFSKIKSYFLAHKIISVVILIVVLAIGYWGYGKLTSTTGDTRYITGTVSKGNIIASVSGSGQVSSSMQVEVKAKASGDVIYVGVKNGQKVGAGALIVELDAKDAQKSVRDAEITLESAKISLEKLKIEKSDANLNADLAKAYDDGFNTVSNVFLDLPGIMTGLDDMFFKSGSGGSQRYVDWYAEQVGSTEIDDALLYKKNFSDSYNAALKAYNDNFQSYKSTSRSSNNTEIENMILQTYDTVKLVSDTVKNANNYIDFVNDSMQRRNFNVPAVINTHKNTLSGYTSKTNTHLTNLLSIKTSIKSFKDAFLNSDLDIQSSALSVKTRENALQDAKDNLADYFVRAPYAGTVTGITIKNKDAVSSGGAVATLVTDKQLAEISFNEVDVAKIKIGQKATLTFDAIPDLTISGIVTEMDSIGAVEQGVVTYNVKITFDTQDARVKPSMSVSSAIITDMKQDVLVVPNGAIKSQSGTSYVEMFDIPLLPPTDGLIGSISTTAPTKIPVEVGLSNDTESEILSGIKEGDEIVTRTILPSTSAAATAPSIFGSTNRAPGGAAVRTQTR